MITYISWLWGANEHSRTSFSVEDVNELEKGLTKNCGKHRLLCFTDQTEGLLPSIEALPIWDNKTPKCLRRMQVFSEDFPKYDEYMVSIDLDCVILKDLSPLFEGDDDLKIWQSKTTRNPYNGSLWRFKHGACRELSLWSPERDRELRQPFHVGSDQAWMHMIYPDLPTWTIEDGVYAYKQHCREALPEDAKVVFFPGKPKAKDPRVIHKHEWVREYYE